jgi:hypothetical protein
LITFDLFLNKKWGNSILSTVGLGEYLESEAQENWTINFEFPTITDGYGMTITKDSEDGTTTDKYKVIATPGGVSATIK